jgi:hypothetical protein
MFRLVCPVSTGTPLTVVAERFRKFGFCVRPEGTRSFEGPPAGSMPAGRLQRHVLQHR